MSVISRYFTFIFFKHFSVCLTGFVALYLVVDIIEKISDFISNNIPIRTIFTYFFAQIPTVIILLSPVAALTATLLTLLILARNSEIVAFKSSGVSLFRLSRPLIASGLALSFAIFLLSNLAAPSTAKLANRIWEVQVKRSNAVDSQFVSDVWIKEPRIFQRLQSYDESQGMAMGITILLLDDRLDLSRRIEAQWGVFSAQGLTLYKVKEKIYRPKTNQTPQSFTLKIYPSLFLANIPVPPPGIGRRGETKADETSVVGLSESINNLKAEGFNPVRQEVDFQFKISGPLISLVMVILGIPIGFWREKGGSVAVGLIIGLILSFFYLVGQEIFKSMGYASVIPPFMSAWLPNIFFGLTGLFLFSHVRQ
ncbi:MAG: LptF/LptG family permease [Deltaproteobacteria bacterium]|jgi:lipopolysaccharide export system permease protein|nr:LptF/LptG family permease [Deltaproteobacteria bacterium]